LLQAETIKRAVFCAKNERPPRKNYNSIYRFACVVGPQRRTWQAQHRAGWTQISAGIETITGDPTPPKPMYPHINHRTTERLLVIIIIQSAERLVQRVLYAWPVLNDFWGLRTVHN